MTLFNKTNANPAPLDLIVGQTLLPEQDHV
jgi:hypothetical protein